MKKIMLMLAILGCSLGSYAQKVVYKCPAKVAHKSVAKRTAVKKTIHKPSFASSAFSWRGVVSCSTDTACASTTVSNDTSFAGYMSGDIALRPRFGNLVITSSAFTNGSSMPSKYTCDGQQVSPPLNVANIPSGTQSLAIVMFDPQGAGNTAVTHWLMWNITDTTGVIPENFINDNASFNHITQQYGYNAACPFGGEHSYHFKVYALDTKLKLNRRTTDRETLERAMRGHVLANGELVGNYAR